MLQVKEQEGKGSGRTKSNPHRNVLHVVYDVCDGSLLDHSIKETLEDI